LQVTASIERIVYEMVGQLAAGGVEWQQAITMLEMVPHQLLTLVAVIQLLGAVGACVTSHADLRCMHA
jgi:hypothetical protein